MNTLWNEPKQLRSRKRVDSVIANATTLIASKGLDGFTMQDVATKTAIPIGSLYQFFPDRNALIAKMFSNLLLETDAVIQDAFDRVESIDQLETETRGIVSKLHEIARSRKAYVEISQSTQALPSISHLEQENNLKNADLMFRTIVRVSPSSLPHQKVKTACLLISSLVSATIRIAVKLPKEDAVLLVKEFEEMSGAHFRTILEGTH